MSEYKRYTNEQIEQAKNTDLAEFVKLQGFDCEKTGREIHIKGYGGLYINPQKNNFYNFSESTGGVGALQFCQKVMGMSFLEAMKTLAGEAKEVRQFSENKPQELPKEKRDFKAPEKSDNCKKVYAYLINQRSISPGLINDFIKQGILYQGYTESVKDGKTYKHENAVFLHKNEEGKPCGAQIQGVNSFMRFKQNVAPDETDKGFVYTKGDPKKVDTVYLFEAPIDLMSFVELHPEIENAKFVAMGGLKPSIAENYINSDLNVVSCVDNDSAGQEFNNRILSGKMQESLSVRSGDVTAKTVKDREPPIIFLEAEVNGRESSFFLSREDYKDAAALNINIRSSAFIWVNKSNFTVNRECAEAGVKDFNDLLKSVKSSEKSPQEECKRFVEETKSIADWTDKASEKAAERESSSRENIR